METIITNTNGDYIAIQSNGGITWVGSWSNEVRHIFYTTCKNTNTEPTPEFLIECLKDVRNLQKKTK